MISLEAIAVLTQDHCEICGLADQQSASAGEGRVRVTCARCGTFDWEPNTPRLAPITGERQVKLSALVREQNAAGSVPFLNSELIKQIDLRSRPRLRDRALRALAAMVQKFGYDPHTTFSVSDDLQIPAVSYSANNEELSVLLEILELDGLIKTEGLIPTTVRITPVGLIQAEELSRSGTENLQGFVAMSFDPSMNEAYTLGFDPAIRSAGYQPFRIDGKEHANGISDEILTEIRRSRFLIADYTLQNNGVYFEAGVAIGLGIRVIPTCRADQLKMLHFDIRHINTLKWETPAQLARDLARRISGVIGDGPLRSGPPIANTGR
jgi:hypothetical protein